MHSPHADSILLLIHHATPSQPSSSSKTELEVKWLARMYSSLQLQPNWSDYLHSSWSVAQECKFQDMYWMVELKYLLPWPIEAGFTIRSLVEAPVVFMTPRYNDLHEGRDTYYVFFTPLEVQSLQAARKLEYIFLELTKSQTSIWEDWNLRDKT